MSVSVVPASQPVKVLRLQQHRHMAPIHEGNVLGTPLIDQQVIDESSATTVMSRPALRTCPRLELVNELANHQDPQICFGIAATDGHDADRVCIFERSSRPAFARPRGKQASPRCVGTLPRGLIGTVPAAPHSSRARNFSTRRAERSHRWPIVD